MESGYDTIGGGTTGAVSGAASGAMAGAYFGPIGIAAGAVLGGLLGKKKTKVPKPPSYSQMMQGALTAQEGIQGRLIGLEREWRPEWQSLNEQSMLSQLYGGDGNMGYLSILNRVQGDVGELERAGVRETLGQVRELTPEARRAMLSGTQQMMLNRLNQQALGLDLEGGLSSAQTRMAQQSARSAMAARGLTGRQAVAAEVLNMESARSVREQQNRAQYLQTLQLETGIQDAATRMAMSGLSAATARGQLIGAAGSVGGAQTQIFNPESQMAAQAAGMQYQHGMKLAQSKMQAQQGMLQSLGALGSFAMMNPGMFSFGGGTFNGLPSQSIASVPNGTPGGFTGYSAPIGPTMPGM